MEYMPPVVVRLVGDIKDFQAKMAVAEAEMGAASTRMGRGFNMIGVAAGVAGLAVATFATKLAIDGVQAAIEDEKAASKLAQTMTNLGLAHDTAPVENMIDAMQRQYGVADEKLRPAFEKLIRTTNDTAQAQDLLKVSMDLAAGTGKDLESVAAAMAKAANGQATALRRLAPELDANILKTGDLNAITNEISKTYAGQAQKAAQTYQGQIERLKIGFDELKESFGYGFLNALSNTENGTDSLMRALKNLEPAVNNLGKRAGETTDGLGKILAALEDVSSTTNKTADETTWYNTALNYMINDFPLFWNGLRTMGNIIGWLQGKTDDGAAAWKDYWGAAAGPGGGDIPGGGTFGSTSTIDGKNWGAYYLQNQSVQEQMALARVNSRKIYDEWVAGLNGDGAGGSGAAPSPSDPVVKAGMNIVDGLITGVSFGRVKLSDEARATIDSAVQSFNDAVQSKRDYMRQVSDDLVGMLDFADAVKIAEETGASIVDAFVEQSKKVAAFGQNMITLMNAGLNETSWNQIYAMGAENGAKVADALINGNMAENIARTNDAVGSVRVMAEEIGLKAADSFKQIGIDNAVTFLEAMIKELLPEGKARRRLMLALDKLAEDSARTTTLTVRTVVEGGGGAGSIGSAASAPLASSLTMFPELSGQAWIDAVQSDPLWQMLNLPGGSMIGFADGGWVNRTGLAKVHAREFVLSDDMLSGRAPVPSDVKQKVAGGNQIIVNAQTNADPFAISREIAWGLKVGVM